MSYKKDCKFIIADIFVISAFYFAQLKKALIFSSFMQKAPDNGLITIAEGFL